MVFRRYLIIGFFCTLFAFVLCIRTGLSQQQIQQSENQIQSTTKTPKEIRFTYQMNRSAKDLKWSVTYFESYKKSGEVSYLNLAAQFCLKTINRLFNTQNLLSRTTRFYQQADQKRLQACQYYDMLQKQSFLLAPVHHLADTELACQ